jgi:hypothetical protein
MSRDLYTLSPLNNNRVYSVPRVQTGEGKTNGRRECVSCLGSPIVSDLVWTPSSNPDFSRNPISPAHRFPSPPLPVSTCCTSTPSPTFAPYYLASKLTPTASYLFPAVRIGNYRTKQASISKPGLAMSGSDFDKALIA